jgi:uncharacterized Rmd1/YagE family protein
MKTNTKSSTDQSSDHDIIFVKAFDIASAYDLKAAREIMERELSAKIVHPNPLLIHIESQKYIAVFDYGSIVFFNTEPKEVRRITEKLKSCAHRLNKTVSEDDFILHIAPRIHRPLGTDELYVKEFNRDIALMVSIVLSRSVSLEYYESMVNNSLARLENTVMALSIDGKLPKKQRDLTKQVGFGLSVEHELAYNLSVLEDPDVLWDGGTKIAQLYKDLKGAFDLEDRIKIIQQKISITSRSSTFLISRLEAQRSNILEWIIIILILSEIILALLNKM